MEAGKITAPRERNVGFWHIASFRCVAKFGRYWSSSGHCSTPARNVSVENDPTETLAARTNPGNLEVMRAGISGPSQPELGSYFLRISSSGLQYLAARLARGDINNSDCIALFVIF
jgi:hypothetical protein